MDDGHNNGGVILQTNSYTIAEVELLVKILQINFNITSKIRYEKGKPIIYIFKDQLPILRILIIDYMHSSIFYKLGL
jgi:LAGLIDADG DNA endonuclease family